jgi:uncharacterized membrane protein YhaH (DUF805 family)
MDWGHFLFGFSGRINRAKYWLWVLIYFIAAIVVAIVMAVINSDMVGGIVQFAFSVAAFISALAIMSKRLHDRNKSAWWILLFVVVPMILLGIGIGAAVYGVIVSGADAANFDFGKLGAVGIVCLLATLAIYIWAFVELGCLRGTVGPNQYGADPLEGKI